jgi:acyl-coenzyme A thioesterase PaaI-like protein
MSAVKRLAPREDNLCFGCGAGNPRSMLLTFDADEEARRIRGEFKIGPEYQGGAGFLHGGVIALIIDEAMGKVCRFRQARAVTAEMTVEYRKPIGVNQEIVVEAFESEEPKGRNLFHVCEIRNREGAILAYGRGRFVIVGEKFIADLARARQVDVRT